MLLFPCFLLIITQLPVVVREPYEENWGETGHCYFVAPVAPVAPVALVSCAVTQQCDVIRNVCVRLREGDVIRVMSVSKCALTQASVRPQHTNATHTHTH